MSIKILLSYNKYAVNLCVSQFYRLEVYNFSLYAMVVFIEVALLCTFFFFQTVPEGENVELTAKLTGTEPITIKWIKDKKALVANDRIKTSFARGLATLTLTKATVADTGVYGIDAKNPIGTLSNTCSLTVKGKQYVGREQ